MTTNYLEEVQGYFKNKAHAYDLVENQVYWQLSDQLLWHALQTLVVSQLPTDAFEFIDVGGGTGRWSFRLLHHHPHSQGTIYDYSESMLEQARAKVDPETEGRIRLLNGDAQNMHEIPDHSFDLAFNFHNVIGFVTSPQHLIQEMSRVVKPGGWVLTFAPNLYHTLYFNVLHGERDRIEGMLSQRRGRFTPDMPDMHLFTPQQLVEMYQNAGIDMHVLTGFPVTLYPGYQETQLHGDTTTLRNILDDTEFFQRLLALEKNLLENHPDLAARGNNIFALGRKR